MGLAITELPEQFQSHRRLKKVYEDRRKMIETGENVDWGMAEALAFGTLLAEGSPLCLPNRVWCILENLLQDKKGTGLLYLSSKTAGDHILTA